MLTLNFAFRQKTKKLTVPQKISHQDLYNLIEGSFKLQQKVIGLTDSQGQLINFDRVRKTSSIYEKQKLYLIVSQDLNDQNMSFASDHGTQQKRGHENKKQIEKPETCHDTNIPQKLEGFYQGVIGDLELFENMFLEENQVTIVFCFVKEKPKNLSYPYYLYHTSKNSAIVYYGPNRICEFFIQSMNQVPKSIQTFVRSLAPNLVKEFEREQPEKDFKKKSKAASSKVSSKQSEQKFLLNNNKTINKNKPNPQQKQTISDSQDKLIDLQENDNQILSEVQNPLHNQLQEEEQNRESQQCEKQQQVELSQSSEGNNSQAEIQTSLLQNLLKLRDDGQITELEFYKMKSQLLQNLSDFMRKYQMGTRKGLRRQANIYNAEEERQQKRSYQSNQFNKPKRQIHHERKTRLKQQKQAKQYRLQQKQQQRNTRTSQSKGVAWSAYSREQRRSKKYQIPIIVRKYNNVIEKISTSYPLTQEQQQAINLILQLELKGLISQKQSGIYKTCILQEDKDVYPLFLDYFDNLIDQLELVSQLKKIKRINSEKKQRSKHNMRLLIKHARQTSYELLRTLLLEKNHLVLAALEKFRNDKNAEKLSSRLEKIAIVYRQKGELEEEVFD